MLNIFEPARRDCTRITRDFLGDTTTLSCTARPSATVAAVELKPKSLVLVALPDAVTSRRGEKRNVAWGEADTTRRNCQVAAELGRSRASNTPFAADFPTYAVVNRAVPARRYCTLTVRAALGNTVTRLVISPPTRTAAGALTNPESLVTDFVAVAADAEVAGISPAPDTINRPVTSERPRRNEADRDIKAPPQTRSRTIPALKRVVGRWETNLTPQAGWRWSHRGRLACRPSRPSGPIA